MDDYIYRRCTWCNGYRRWKWTRQHEFKSWTRLIAFHIALIPLGKVWIQLFSLQLTSHKQKNSRSEDDVYTSAWDSKRWYKVSNFGLKAEIQWSLKWKGEVRWSLKRREKPVGHSRRPVSSPCVFTGCRTISQKRSPPHKICANSLWLYSYDTLSSLSKNKNINYIFIYLRVLRCLSSGSIYATLIHTFSLA